MTWDGEVANWGFGSEPGLPNSHWLDGDPDAVPTPALAANVNSGICTVDDTQAALGLKVRELGTVDIAASGALAVGTEVIVANSATLAVDGSLLADSLTTFSTTSFGPGSTATIGMFEVKGGTTTFAAGSTGTIETFNVKGGSTTMATPDITTLNVSGGSLSMCRLSTGRAPWDAGSGRLVRQGDVAAGAGTSY